MIQPKVTILMPAYNASLYIKESIESMLNQSFSDFELLIINDGSKDNTSEVVKSIVDERIRLVENEQNLGLANTLNKGMKLAKGEYLARMDADDLSTPNRLQTQVDYLDSHPDVILCSMAMHQFGAIEKDLVLPQDFERIKIDLLFASAIGHASSMWRNQEFIEKKLFFKQDEFPAEDFGLWTRAVREGKLVNLPEIMYMYRIYPEQVTADKTRSIEKCHLVIKRYIRQILPEIDDQIVENFVLGKMLNVRLYYQLIESLKASNFFDNHRMEKTLRKSLLQKLKEHKRWGAYVINWFKYLIFRLK